MKFDLQQENVDERNEKSRSSWSNVNPLGCPKGHNTEKYNLVQGLITSKSRDLLDEGLIGRNF